MANFFKDNDDLRYYFEKRIDWESIARVTEFRDSPDGFRDAVEAAEFYRDIAEMVGEFVADEVAPVSAEIDRVGARLEGGEVQMAPAMDAIFAQIRGLDLHGMGLPRELGGLNAPMLLYFVNTELFARADVSVMAHHSFHSGIAMALLMFSLREGTTEVDSETGTILDTRFAAEIAEIAAGEAWGCMDITEPDAGSDMAALRTIAEQDDAGEWFVSGQKIFITSGHGKFHFVIARTEGIEGRRAGLDGLSMFLVRAYEDNADGTRTRFATVDRIEEKMGHHGSVTASITFDRSPAQLIGASGEGFRHMLQLMNNARLGVGFESIGMCEAAFRAARGYAAERPSMGKTIDRHEMIADYLDEMESDIVGLRALAMEGAFHEEMAQKLQVISLVANSAEVPGDVRQRIERHQRKARHVTPLLKYLAAEKAVEMARLAVQIHGGNGYMKEYPVEKLLRDAMVMPIYEGTSQIQALMAMKDSLSAVLKNPQAFVVETAQARWRSLSARDPLERRVAKLSALALSVRQQLVTKTVTDRVRSLHGEPLTSWPSAFTRNWDPKRDFAHAMLHAERLIRILADVEICELLLDQATQHTERRVQLERYLERAEPRCRYLADVIATTGSRLLGKLASFDDDVEASARAS